MAQAGCTDSPPRMVQLIYPSAEAGTEGVLRDPQPVVLQAKGHIFSGTQMDGLGREGPPNDNLFIWTGGGAEHIDPNLVSEGAGSNIVQNMVEPLLNPAPKTGPPLPGAATHYEVSEDGLVYTFHLRPEARWSDGEPVTASDFAYSYLRTLSPKTASKAAGLLWKLKNGQAYNQGRLDDSSLVGVKVVEPHKLELTLENPYPYFPYLASEIVYAPVPQRVIERHGSAWTEPQNMVVNGPYRLKEWAIRDKLALERNPHYWDRENVAIDGVVVLHSESEVGAFQLYEAGKVHWVPSMVPSEKIPSLMAEDRGDFYVDPHLCTYFYELRVDRPPFDSLDVRKAFASSVDKERLVKHVTRGGQMAATHVVPSLFSQVSGYRSPQGLPYDPEATAQFLSRAGYPRGKGLADITLLYNTSEGHRKVAESVQESAGEAMNVPIKIENMEWKSLLQRIRSGEFELARGGWCADYPDPMAFLEIFHSENENNNSGYKNPAYDALLARIDRTSNSEKRNALMAKAEGILNAELPVVPVYFYTRVYLLKPYVQGFEPQFQERHLVKDMWFVREEAP